MRQENLKGSLTEKVDLAIKWMLNSKIHNGDRSDPAVFGSFNNYYDIRRRLCPYAYTEITAYGIELFLDLYKRTGRSEYLDKAITAGNWIMRMQYDGTVEEAKGGFLQCYHLLERTEGLEVFSFDTAICVGALSDLYGESHNNAYLESAEKGAQWLVRKMQNKDGSFKPFCNLGEMKQEANTYGTASARSGSSDLRATWYYLNGCHHGKMVIGLLKCYLKHRQPWLSDSVASLCQWLLAQQDSQGHFRVSRNSNAFFSHTHCYAIEGLLYAYSHSRDKHLIDSAILAGDYLINMQGSDGSIPSWKNVPHILKYTDVSAVAQAIRLWSVLCSETKTPKYHRALKKALKYLITMQSLEHEPNLRGGFYQAEFDLKLVKHKLKRLYSWTTMFAIHAMNLSNDVLRRKIEGTELW
jgi:hypothetical protein